MVVALLMSGCGPGISDSTTTILDGYSFSDAGGKEKAIIYNGKKRAEGFVVDAVVVDLSVSDPWISVLRRPRITKLVGDHLESSLENHCEIWIINVESHEALGPLSKNNFESWRAKSGVSAPLNFNLCSDF